MARNNHVWVKGDITGDIYFDVLKLDGKEVQFLRMYIMTKGVKGAAAVKGLRICVYGPMAELVYGYVHKGSRIGVTGHIQQRHTHDGKMVFEVVAAEVDFLRNIDWEAGARVRQDLVARGLLHSPNRDEDISGGALIDTTGLFEQDAYATSEDMTADEG
ncbi:MAG: single-stranded DNA-binding protein [Anaerolineaceae bacterium]|nr:single-stranded DNA-binding protein [Anaerolineaceae bacterium]